MIEYHNEEGNTTVFKLQTKVQWLEKRLKAVPVTQTFKDIFHLDSSVTALTNKVGFEKPDMAPKTIMDDVECLSTHVKEVEAKVEAVGVASQISVQCDAMVKGWIATYKSDVGAIIQNCLKFVSSKLFSHLLPTETFFASVEPFGVSKLLLMVLQMPIFGEILLAQIA